VRVCVGMHVFLYVETHDGTRAVSKKYIWVCVRESMRV